jgi:hypothetical protein
MNARDASHPNIVARAGLRTAQQAMNKPIYSRMNTNPEASLISLRL